MDKQVINSQFEVEYLYNSNWIDFFGFPVSIKYTNAMYRFEPEYFAGSATDKALSGKLRSNLRGYRCKVTLDWNFTSQSNIIFDALSNLVIGSRKIAAQTTADGAGVATTTLQTNDAIFSAGSLLDGLKLKIGGNAEVTITPTATNETTISVAQSWANGATVIMYAEASFPVRLRFEPDQTKSDVFTAILSASSLEAIMQYTIFRQPFSITLESETLFDEIPSWFIL
jgi:hypothetical protein